MKSPAPAAGKQTVVGKNATHAKPTAAQHKMRVEAAKKAAVTRKHNLELAKKHHAAASKKHHPKPKRKLALNGDVACCAAEAVAASLRLAGHLVTDPDVYALYKTTAAGPDTGATIQETLEALMRHGLAGVRPLGFGPAAALEPGAVLGLTLTDAQRRQDVWDWEDAPEWGPHAVTLSSRGVLTWGALVPVTRAFLGHAEEAWAIRWAA